MAVPLACFRHTAMERSRSQLITTKSVFRYLTTSSSERLSNLQRMEQPWMDEFVPVRSLARKAKKTHRRYWTSVIFALLWLWQRIFCGGQCSLWSSAVTTDTPNLYLPTTLAVTWRRIGVSADWTSRRAPPQIFFERPARPARPIMT